MPCAAFRPGCCALVLHTAAKSRARCQPRARRIRVAMSTRNKQIMSLQQVQGLTGHEARCVGSLLGTLCGDTLGAHHSALESPTYPCQSEGPSSWKSRPTQTQGYPCYALQNRCKSIVNNGTSMTRYANTCLHADTPPARMCFSGGVLLNQGQVT